MGIIHLLLTIAVYCLLSFVLFAISRFPIALLSKIANGNLVIIG